MHDVIAGAVGAEPSDWGLLFKEDPTRCSADARLFWRADHDSSVLSVVAENVSSKHGECFDIDKLPIAPTILEAPDGREHLSLSDGQRRVRLDVQSGTLREGPVMLHYQLAGLHGIEPQLLTLHRLLAFCRLGRFAIGLDPPEKRADRWITMLRAYDATLAGASQREIASELFGADRVREEWRSSSDSLRLRIQRMVRGGNELVNGGYRGLLGSVNSGTK